MVDFISVCPSLYEILQYMTFKDYGNCHLVNRRFRDVISANSRTLKPEARWMVIRANEEADGQCVEIRAFRNSSMPMHSAFVTDKLIILKSCRKREDCSFFSRMSEESSGSKYSLDKIETKTIQGLIRNPLTNKSEHCRLFQTNSLEEGLERVLAPETSGHHWVELFLDRLPTRWINVVTEVFHQNRSRCRVFRADMSLASLRFLSTIECSAVHLNLAIDDGFMGKLLEFISWQRRMRITLRSKRHQMKTLLASLLQKWQTGSFSMNKVCLNFTIFGGIPPSFVER